MNSDLSQDESILELTPIERLVRDFNQQSLRYCHWKSNLRLADALKGEDDFDLLVDSKQLQVAQDILLRNGFRMLETDFDEFHPGLRHYVGFGPSGHLFHVHLYPHIFSGDTFLKNYKFPREDWLLDHSQKYLEVNIPNYGVEATLLVLRLFLKMAHISDWIFLFRDLQPLRDEWKELAKLRKREDSIRYLVECYSSIDLPFYESMEACLRNGTARLPMIFLGLKLKSKMKACRRHSLLRALFLRLKLISFLVRKRLFGHKMMRLNKDGMLVAFVGPPATGKSTLISTTHSCLRKFSKIEVIHVGKPPAVWPTLLFRAILPLARKIAPSKRSTQQEMQSLGKPKPSFAYVLRMLVLAYERRRLIKKIESQVKNKKKIILCDRFPSSLVGYVDGPQFSEKDASLVSSKLISWMMNCERRLYQGLIRPDLLVVLSVPVEVAIERNQNRSKQSPQSDDFVAFRHRQNSEIQFEDQEQMIVDTRQAIEVCAQQIQARLWKIL